MARRTEGVQRTVNHTWAMLASAMAQRAYDEAKYGRGGSAEAAMEYVETWLDKAGAHATNFYFRQPR